MKAGIPHHFGQFDPGVDLLRCGIVGQFEAEGVYVVAQARLEVETAEHLLLELVDDLLAFGGGKPRRPVPST
ncbi:hypothetical protein ACIA98_32915 [Streptomyces sp. NPDC051366]|uniref:hypothetical protein n=1 Tax=Streptomyces sp. NPDC051366 TaxID=3365652 RepID=UPI0037B86E14